MVALGKFPDLGHASGTPSSAAATGRTSCRPAGDAGSPARRRGGFPLPAAALPSEGGDLDLVPFPTALRGDGRGADLPWLREVPDTVSSLSWTRPGPRSRPRPPGGSAWRPATSSRSPPPPAGPRRRPTCTPGYATTPWPSRSAAPRHSPSCPSLATSGRARSPSAPRGQRSRGRAAESLAPHPRGEPLPARARDRANRQRGGAGAPPARPLASHVPRARAPRPPLGHGHRPRPVHRMPGVRGGLLRREQRPGHGARGGREGALHGLAPAGALPRRRARRRAGGEPAADAVPAVHQRALRARLPRLRHLPHGRGAERAGLQPLRRDALLLATTVRTRSEPSTGGTPSSRSPSRCSSTPTSPCAPRASWRSAPSACSASASPRTRLATRGGR